MNQGLNSTIPSEGTSLRYICRKVLFTLNGSNCLHPYYEVYSSFCFSLIFLDVHPLIPTLDSPTPSSPVLPGTLCLVLGLVPLGIFSTNPKLEVKLPLPFSIYKIVDQYPIKPLIV